MTGDKLSTISNDREGMYLKAEKYLSDFIAIKSINPPGEEMDALLYISGILEKAGLNAVIHESAPKRGVLLCTIEGSDSSKKPLVLLNHVDVVDADEKYWDVPAFSGEVKDGYIYGRGALDMKCMGIMELMAFLQVADSNIQPERGLIYLAVSDEERSGELGAQWAIQNLPELLDAEFVFNEGGYGMQDTLFKGVLFAVEVGQKSDLKVRLTAVGKPGHGNSPAKSSAIISLVKALDRLTSYNFPIRVNPVIAELFKRISYHKSFPESLIMRHVSSFISRIFLKKELESDKMLNAHFRNTIGITTLKAGNALNAVPAEAEATLDLRILPGENHLSVLKQIKNVINDPCIKIEPISQMFEANVSPYDSLWFELIENAIKKEFPGSVISPYMDIGGSDSRHFRKRGLPAYGIIPIVIDSKEQSSIHGNNERISLKNFHSGLNVVCDIVNQVCFSYDK